MLPLILQFSSVQSLSRVQLFVTPWIAATPGLPVNHHLPDGAHVHPVGDAIQPFHPLSSPFPPVLNLSLNLSQGLFQWVNSSWGGQSTGISALASFFPENTQDWCPLEWTGWISLQSKGLFKSLLQHHSSKASILWHSAFFMVSNSHIHMWLLEKP